MTPAQDSPQFDTGLRPDQLTADRGTPVETPWGIFAVYQTPEGPRAAEAFCPHLDGPLFEGSGRDGHITCPWHLWRFDLTTGLCVDSPENAGCDSKIRCLPVEIGPGGTLLLGPQSS
ncbi:MAG: Rieske (2Fe-2S) protein [Planctomycetota bacterium]|nr:Rieske (2Fe-2S) protein [Planctomycetota bacterium]